MIEQIAIGFSVILCLCQITQIAKLLLNKFPENFLSIIYGMVLVDGMIVVFWALFFKYYVEDYRLFGGGLGLALIVNMIIKIKKFLK